MNTQPNQNDDQRNAPERAEFFRALADALADGLPMPFQVYFGAVRSTVQLRYRSAEEVDACVAGIDGTAVHDDHHHDGDPKYHSEGWHGYGTSYAGGTNGRFAGLTVEVWTVIDGPPPATTGGAR